MECVIPGVLDSVSECGGDSKGRLQYRQPVIHYRETV